MTETLPDPPELDPAGVAGTSFTRARRGFEPAEVHAALGRVADALRAWKLRDATLLTRIEALEQQLVEAQRMDESHLTAVLGEETARIITAARDAATEIRANAEEKAARLLQETEDAATGAAEALKGEAQALRDEAARARDEAVAEATRVRTEAETAAATSDAEARARHDELIAEADAVLAVRTAEADDVASGITEAAQVTLDSATADAARLRQDVAEESAAILDAAREQGRSMVNEAKSVRERILRDLVERRATARRQIEGARAGRDRVIEMLRSTIDDVQSTIDGLGDAEGVAGVAASEAAAQVIVDAEAEVAELLVELGEDPADPLGSGLAAIDHATAAPVDAAPAPVESAEASADPVDSSEPRAVAEVVETVDAEELDVVESVDTAERPASDDDLDGAELEDDDDDDDDEAPGATVHDLFARIRAEGLEPGDEPDGSELDDDAVPDDAVPGDPVAGEDAATSDDTVDLVGADGGEAHGVQDGGEDDDGSTDEAEPLPAAVGDSGIDLTRDPSTPAAVTPAAETGTANGSDGSNGSAAELTPNGGGVATLATATQLLDRRDELLTPVEKGLSRALRRLASDEQNELLDQLRRVKRGRPDPVLLAPLGGEVAVGRYVDALAPEFAKAAEAGSEFWSEVAGSSAGALFGDDDQLRERLAAGVTEFLDLHRAHLERTFSDAESEALDVADLADRVRAAYRDWRTGSLADLAGDLATAGFAHGERRAAGPGTPWRWVVDNGGLPCADGEDNALAGAVPCEEPFPTGDLTPPAHPGCRCILAPAHQ